MNLTGKHAGSVQPAAAGPEYPGLSSQSNLLSWAGTFGQGLTSLTKGVWATYHLLFLFFLRV